jgi:hypothetical protein
MQRPPARLLSGKAIAEIPNVPRLPLSPTLSRDAVGVACTICRSAIEKIYAALHRTLDGLLFIRQCRPWCLPGIFLQWLYDHYSHLFHQRLGSPHKRGIGSSKPNNSSFCRKGNLSGDRDGISFAEFLCMGWICQHCAHLLPVHRIGLEAKSPGLSCSTSSAMVAMCKRGNSDCIPKRNSCSVLYDHRRRGSVSVTNVNFAWFSQESLFECIGFLGRVDAPGKLSLSGMKWASWRCLP